MEMEYSSHLNDWMITNLQDVAIRAEEEKHGRYLDGRTINTIIRRVRARIMARCAERLRELIEAFLHTEAFKDMPRIQVIPFSVVCRNGAGLSSLIVTVKSDGWSEYLSNTGAKELEARIGCFLHDTTVWVDGSRDWVMWQNTMERELIMEFSAKAS